MDTEILLMDSKFLKANESFFERILTGDFNKDLVSFANHMKSTSFCLQISDGHYQKYSKFLDHAIEILYLLSALDDFYRKVMYRILDDNRYLVIPTEADDLKKVWFTKNGLIITRDYKNTDLINNNLCHAIIKSSCFQII